MTAIAYVSVCRNCHAIGGASSDKNGPIYHPVHNVCYANTSNEYRHVMDLVPVVVPVE